MNNFMGCISLIIDNKDKICVTYKSGQPNFSTYKRKYDHGFREIIDDNSREGCRGVNVPSKGYFLISDDDFVQAHDQKTYKAINKLEIPLKESETDDKMEILNIKVSPNEKYLAVLGGKNLIKGIEELWELHIYLLTSGSAFKHVKSIDLPEEFRSFSVSFEYMEKDQDSTLIFTDVNGIMKYNFMKEQLI